MIGISFKRVTMNERWSACQFKVPEFEQRLQSYGRNEQEAYSRMLEILVRRFGSKNFKLSEEK